VGRFITTLAVLACLVGSAAAEPPTLNAYRELPDVDAEATLTALPRETMAFQSAIAELDDAGRRHPRQLLHRARRAGR